MKFKTVLNEKAQEIPLLIWNDMQKELWYSLIAIGIVEKNDMDVFTKFAKFFADFYTTKHKFPNIKDVMSIL